MTEPQPSERVRITAQSAREHTPPATSAVEPSTVYLRALIKAQLRLALYCLLAFVGLFVLFLATLGYFHELGELHLLGVPFSWWLLGFGAYPLIITTAVIYVRAARRNEATYRQLMRLEGGEPQ